MSLRLLLTLILLVAGYTSIATASSLRDAFEAQNQPPEIKSMSQEVGDLMRSILAHNQMLVRDGRHLLIDFDVRHRTDLPPQGSYRRFEERFSNLTWSPSVLTIVDGYVFTYYEKGDFDRDLIWLGRALSCDCDRRPRSRELTLDSCPQFMHPYALGRIDDSGFSRFELQPQSRRTGIRSPMVTEVEVNPETLECYYQTQLPGLESQGSVRQCNVYRVDDVWPFIEGIGGYYQRDLGWLEIFSAEVAQSVEFSIDQSDHYRGLRGLPTEEMLLGNCSAPSVR